MERGLQLLHEDSIEQAQSTRHGSQAYQGSATDWKEVSDLLKQTFAQNHLWERALHRL